MHQLCCHWQVTVGVASLEQSLHWTGAQISLIEQQLICLVANEQSRGCCILQEAVLRKYAGEEGEVQIMQPVRLSDFVQLSSARRPLRVVR